MYAPNRSLEKSLINIGQQMAEKKSKCPNSFLSLPPLFCCRLFLVVYSDKGLVCSTGVNMKMFNTLFWIAWTTFGFLTCFYSLEQFSTTSNFIYIGIVESIKALIVELIIMYMRTYVNGQCLNQRSFGAFGGNHRRHLFTATETRNLTHYYQIGILLEELFLSLDLQSSRKTIKSVATLYWVFFIGLYLPLKFLHRSQSELPSLFLKPRAQARVNTFCKSSTSYIARSPTIGRSSNESMNGRRSDVCSLQVETAADLKQECDSVVVTVEPKSRFIFVKPFVIME